MNHEVTMKRIFEATDCFVAALQLHFGGEGGGDPLKTISGHPRTEVVCDPDTRCRDYRYAHPLRYANSKENAQDLKLALRKASCRCYDDVKFVA